MRVAPLLFATSSLLLVGCPDEPPVEILGDEGNVTLVSFKIQQGAHFDWAGPHVGVDHVQRYHGEQPLLAGTEACLTWGAGQDGDAGPDCHALTVEAPSVTTQPDAPECFVFEAGTTTLSFTPTPEPPCESDGLALGPDTITLRGVPAQDTVARFVPWPEQWIDETEAELVGTIPEDFQDPYGAELLLAVGGRAELQVGLFAQDEQVAWNDRDGVLALVEADGISVRASAEDATSFEVRGDAEGSARATLSLDEAEWEVASLRSVPTSAIETIEIGALVTEGGASARAFARTAEGELVHGAPVRWSVADASVSWGDGVLEGFLAGDDYTSIGDSCLPPSKRPSTRTVTLRARLGSASDSLELTWTNTPPDDPEQADADWTKPASCRPAGCAGTGCATGGPAPTGLSLLLLLLIRSRLVTRRRERLC